MTRKGGRLGVEDPRRNVITFKVTDHEKLLLEIASSEFENRSEMIRSLVFDYALALDPEEILYLIDEESFKRLKNKVHNK